MSFAETAALVARLSLKDDFSGPLGNAQKKLKGFGSSVGAAGKAAGVAVGAAVGVASTFVVKEVRAGLDSLAILESATTSVDAAIKQMGQTGKITSAQIATWANEIETNVGAAFDDKDITQAATTLIRYGKVAPGAMKQTLTVMTDLAAKTGSVDSAAQALAKSLADPTKATRVLRTVGVSLTKAEQEQIKAWVKSGQLGKAQALILKKVGDATKGAAAAMNGPYVRSQKVLADAVEEAQKALAIGFLPVLEEVRKELSDELAKPETLARIKDFGTTLAGGFRTLVTTLKGLPWNEIGATVGSIVDFGKNLGKGFLDLPPDVKAVLLGLFALNKAGGGAVLKISADLVSSGLSTLFGQFLGKGSPANPMYVVPVGGGLTPPGPGGAPGAVGGLGLLGGLFALTAVAGIELAIATAVAPSFRKWLTGSDKPFADNPYYQDPKNQNPYQRLRGGDPNWKPGDPLGPRQRDAVAHITNAGLSPDERQQRNDAQRTAQAISDSAERSRIQLTTKLQATTDAARTAGINSVAAARSGDRDIVAAIHAIAAPTVNVNVQTNTVRVTYQTGTTMNRYVGKTVPI